ncbi:hypothetical protein [Streptomyces sp. MP131-18]|uniref:hypothetical protein n=1 Tax=Streptomyces sp. MP131-18 TaxID=1857892 RepID=UPI00097BB978|nr:hypothetical protein [Streptomyces sp. MP131-18]ONK13152.1 hypothetical protein STBA_39140 [Streptomyces sp. MP131-18]
MEANGAQVNIGAVQAAWDQATGLRQADNNPAALAELAERIAAATDQYGWRELARGTVFLIGGALVEIAVDAPGAEQFRREFTDVLMTKLKRSQFVDLADLPMVRRVVTVALEGRDVVAWRDQAGPVGDSERRALTSALALISDFVDRVDGPGSCERRVLKALGNALD